MKQTVMQNPIPSLGSLQRNSKDRVALPPNWLVADRVLGGRCSRNCLELALTQTHLSV